MSCRCDFSAAEARLIIFDLDDLLPAALLADACHGAEPAFQTSAIRGFSGDSGSSNAAKSVTEAFADDVHYDLAVWAHHFSSEATTLCRGLPLS